MKKYVAIVMALAFLAGCSIPVGNRELCEPGRFCKIQEGKTTKDEVYELLGDPYEIVRSGSMDEIWVYRGGRLASYKSTKIFFNRKGVVEQVSSAGVLY